LKSGLNLDENEEYLEEDKYNIEKKIKKNLNNFNKKV
jgi:predicted solute-binding protein